jgi:hypothetical protein
MSSRSRVGALALLAVATIAGKARADTELGGDVRFYQFFVVEHEETEQDHAEIASLRGKLLSDLSKSLRLEAHAVINATAPPRLQAGNNFLSGRTRRVADLSWILVDTEDVLAIADVDRLNLRWDRPSFRLTAGRQAITWGVNYFWPVIDLFAPFAPDQVDRDYKAGVDAVRSVVPTGDFSEVEVIAAAQGDNLPDDWSVASLARLHSGNTDFGFLAGRFHTDAVLGTFVTGNVGAVGVRGEASFTDSGDEADAEIDRERFGRATLGIDKQLSPNLGLVGEISWNGFGADDPADYLRIALSDRVRRGEITSLGRWYSGLSLSWQVRPLWTLAEALLFNWTDSSVLLQSFADWSVSNVVTAQFGASVGFGDGLQADGAPGSEYGAVPLNVWAAVKASF